MARTKKDTAAKDLKAKAKAKAAKAPAEPVEPVVGSAEPAAEPAAASSESEDMDIEPSEDLVAAVNEAVAEPKKKRKRSKNPGPKEKKRRHEAYLKRLLRKIRDMQRGGKLLLAKAPFQRYVREEAARHAVNPATRFKRTAMEALQEGAEAFITQFFDKAARSAAIVNTMTVMPNHMLMAGEMVPELPCNVRDDIRLALFHVRDAQLEALENENRRTSQLKYTEDHEKKKPVKFRPVIDVNAILDRAEGKTKKKKTKKTKDGKAEKGAVSPPIAAMEEDAPEEEEEDGDESADEEEEAVEQVATARPVAATAVAV